jgi:hypothetical protein
MMLPASSRLSTFARLAFATVSLAALAAWVAPAAAQTQAASGDTGSSNGGLAMPGINLDGGGQVDEATMQKRREIEQAYKKATKDIPAQATAVNDPWANMRGAEAQPPKAAHRKKQ